MRWMLSLLAVPLVAVGCAADVLDVDANRASLVDGPACFENGCLAQVAPIYVGHRRHIGDVSVLNEGDDLVLTIDTEAGWSFDRARVYVATGSALTKRGHRARLGRPPYRFRYDTPTASRELRIPLDGVACGDTLTIAVRIRALRPAYERRSRRVHAWAFGERLSRGRGGGRAFEYRVCCDTGACVMPPEFWRDQPDAWPPYITILGMGGDLYDQDELIGLLSMGSSSDASIRLAQALIGFKLNYHCGVPVSDSDWEVMHRGSSWFYRNADADGLLPYGVEPASAAGAEAADFSTVLEAFNAGASSAAACVRPLRD